MDRRFVVRVLLPSQGFHSGLHDRARLHGENQTGFRAPNVKVIGLSVDPVENHKRWADDIRETQGHAPNFPMIGDGDLSISKLYGMLPASTAGTSEGRTPADNQTVRNVFVIGPDKKIKLFLVYPMTTGRNFDEVLRVIDSLAADRKASGRDARELAARARMSSSPAPSPTTRQRRSIRRAGRRRGRISASFPRRRPDPRSRGAGRAPRTEGGYRPMSTAACPRRTHDGTRRAPVVASVLRAAYLQRPIRGVGPGDRRMCR